MQSKPFEDSCRNKGPFNQTFVVEKSWLPLSRP